MECNSQKFLLFWTVHFLSFYHPNNQKNQGFKKMKKKTPEDIIILHKCIINGNYTAPQINTISLPVTMNRKIKPPVKLHFRQSQ